MTGGGSLALGRPHASCFLAQLCTVKLRLGRRRETSGPKFRYLALGCPDLGQDLKDARSAGILQSPRVPEGGSTSKKKKNYHVGSRAISSKTAGMCPIVALVGSRSTHGVPRGYSTNVRARDGGEDDDDDDLDGGGRSRLPLSRAGS